VGTATVLDSKQGLFHAQRSTEQTTPALRGPILLLNFLWAALYNGGIVAKTLPKRARPDVDAAERGGDWAQRMDGEGLPGDASLEQAIYWRQVYTEILAMEEKVLERIRQLMKTQSETARREVELTNVPVVVAQAERFRQRLGYWDARVTVLKAKAEST
jgi:hypothetical protein